MAFNKKGGSQFKPQPKVSTELSTFFSTDEQNGSYQMVKISFYGDSISFNFYKGTKGSNNRTQQYISFDFANFSNFYNYVIEPLERQRKIVFASGAEYPVGIWMNKAVQFNDPETHQLRTVGNMIVKSEISPVTQKNTVYICYSNGTEEWKVALGQNSASASFTFENPVIDDKRDISDSGFLAFANLVRSIGQNWVTALISGHQTGIMVSHFNKIEQKLGIETQRRFAGKDNGNYAENNYRSSAPSAASTPNIDAGGFDEGMPF